MNVSLPGYDEYSFNTLTGDYTDQGAAVGTLYPDAGGSGQLYTVFVEPGSLDAFVNGGASLPGGSWFVSGPDVGSLTAEGQGEDFGIVFSGAYSGQTLGPRGLFVSVGGGETGMTNTVAGIVGSVSDAFGSGFDPLIGLVVTAIGILIAVGLGKRFFSNRGHI